MRKANKKWMLSLSHKQSGKFLAHLLGLPLRQLSEAGHRRLSEYEVRRPQRPVEHGRHRRGGRHLQLRVGRREEVQLLETRHRLGLNHGVEVALEHCARAQERRSGRRDTGVSHLLQLVWGSSAYDRYVSPTAQFIENVLAENFAGGTTCL